VVTIAAVLVLVLVLGDKVFGEMISSYRKPQYHAQRGLSLTT
jgi:hypothetical protein